jgi:iron complex transport system substrate-binding protein
MERRNLRIVTLDAALTQTAIMLGTNPIAITNVGFYRSFVIEPFLPSDVIELGHRSEPNIELLVTLAPDLIFFSPEYGPLAAILSEHLRSCSVPIYRQGASAYHAATVLAVEAMASQLGAETAAAEHLKEMNELLMLSRNRVAQVGIHSACILTFLTNRHVRVYSENSLFNGVLQAMAIKNVAEAPSNKWGFSDIAIGALASYDADLFIHIGEIPPRAEASPIWHALPFVRRGRVTSVPTIWMFGGLPSAARFARSLVLAIEAAYER